MTQRAQTWQRLGVGGLAVVLVIIFAPQGLARLDGDAGCVENLKHIADTRTATIQLIAGIAAAVGVFFTWQNFKRAVADAETARIDAQEATRRATDARISDDFVKAVQQLGHDSRAVRAGGALALGRLLQTVGKNEEEYWAIMDVLTAYVREYAQLGRPRQSENRVDGDVEVALNVLARRRLYFRPCRSDDSPTDLSGCDLSRAWMEGGQFYGAYFGYSGLSGAVLKSANLVGADFRGADLRGADFTGADLTNAKFWEANLENAIFKDATLTNSEGRVGTDAWDQDSSSQPQDNGGYDADGGHEGLGACLACGCGCVAISQAFVKRGPAESTSTTAPAPRRPRHSPVGSIPP